MPIPELKRSQASILNASESLLTWRTNCKEQYDSKYADARDPGNQSYSNCQATLALW
jgi:hypothetical protein